MSTLKSILQAPIAEIIPLSETDAAKSADIDLPEAPFSYEPSDDEKTVNYYLGEMRS